MTAKMTTNMNFTVKKGIIHESLNVVSKATAVRGIHPVLSNVLIETVEDNEIKLCATDLDLYIEVKIPAEVGAKGAITLPGKKLTEIISKLPDEKVVFKLDTDTNTVEIKCANSKFDIKGIPSSEFPPVETPDSDEFIDISTSTLLKTIKQTSYATATYDMNNVLSGVFCKINENTLEMAALDGNRLARIKDDIENSDKVNFSVVIPSRTLREFTNIISGTEDEKVKITAKNGQIMFKLTDRYMTSRLIEGQYPNYEQLIPTNYEKKAKIDRSKFLSALDRVATMVNERTNTVKLSFTKNNLKISADAPDLGDSHDEFSIEYTAESLDIAFNYKYIQDFLKIMDTENIIMEMDGALSGVVFKSENEKDAICLVMPVQID